MISYHDLHECQGLDAFSLLFSAHIRGVLAIPVIAEAIEHVFSGTYCPPLDGRHCIVPDLNQMLDKAPILTFHLPTGFGQLDVTLFDTDLPNTVYNNVQKDFAPMVQKMCTR